MTLDLVVLLILLSFNMVMTIPRKLVKPLPAAKVSPPKVGQRKGLGTTRPQVFKPQAGPQEAFLACPADVAIYGGAAGGGKTFALILDQARWCANVANFFGVIFRRTYPEITNQGGLWDETYSMLPGMGATPNKGDVKWSWPNGSSIKLSHMQHAEDRFSWQGSQPTVASFDELTHFDEVVFWYMLSRLRSTCGVKPYLRATCNPEVTSWVRDLISWWVDERTGFPIPERGGVVRWFVRTGDKITWGSSKDDPAFLGQEPLSFTFIPAKVTDNPALLTKDPDYLTKLRNLPAYERATLLEGNWNVRLTKGMIFQRERFGVLPAVPADVVKWVRYWDRGATEPSAANPDPDATSGTLMGRRANGRVVVAHECNLKVTPHRVLEGIKNLAAQDPEGTEVWLEQDPGQAGVAEISYLSINLAGFDVRANKVTTSKLTRAKPFASQVELGNVDIVKGPWNEAYLQELEAFVDEDAVDPPPGYHDDRVDSSSGAYNALMSAPNPRVR